jgi:hypothetical protein
MSRSLFPHRLRLRSERSGCCASPEIPEDTAPQTQDQRNGCQRLRCGCKNHQGKDCPAGNPPESDQTESQ